jgi:hypothetical protein
MRRLLECWYGIDLDQRKVVSRFALLVAVLGTGPHSVAGLMVTWTALDYLLID